jgi:DNA-binding transcriptional LysR family regulator
MVLVVPPRHALARRKAIGAKQLAEHPLIVREVGSGLRHNLENSLERAGLSLADFEIALELGSNEAIKEAVKRGAGVAILSRFAVGQELKARQLRAVEVRDLSLSREIFLVLDRRRVLPLPARMFLLFLESHPLVGGA